MENQPPEDRAHPVVLDYLGTSRERKRSFRWRQFALGVAILLAFGSVCVVGRKGEMIPIGPAVVLGLAKFARMMLWKTTIIIGLPVWGAAVALLVFNTGPSTLARRIAGNVGIICLTAMLAIVEVLSTGRVITALTAVPFLMLSLIKLVTA